ncbi:MAG: homoserine O-acetyltransferase/O-succinyltransferase family protein [Solirubrobacteraceae bacterium]
MLGPHALTIGLVNNMPDGAFADTEAQFRRALAAPGRGVRLALYTLPQIERGEAVSEIIAARYGDLEQLWLRPPDALVVTGTEPLRAQLCHEAYWPDLAQLLSWAAECVPTVLLSCLAAHAGVLLFDGISRVPRATKCCGVFAGAVDRGADLLTGGLPSRVRVPHSRANDIPEASLIEAGYRIAVGSDPAAAGWSIATRAVGRATFVLCQGHPEYGRLSLLREYRRDVRRSLLSGGARPYPRIPEGYLSPPAIATLSGFERWATESTGDPRALVGAFPYEQVAATVTNSWKATSAVLYRNWLELARESLAVAA